MIFLIMTSFLSVSVFSARRVVRTRVRQCRPCDIPARATLVPVWRKLGETMGIRVYLTGQLAIECSERLLDQTAFPGPQGRLAFAFLVVERQRAVPREELA